MNWLTLRTWLLQIHLYIGLFCAPYLLILGITSLEFNHPWAWMDGKDGTPQQENLSMELPSVEDPKTLGLAMQDSLGLMGWYVPWDSHLDSTSYQVVIVHAGKRYTFTGERNSSTVQMTTVARPFGSILHLLHGLGENVPGAPFWVNAWQYYQDLTVYAIVFWTLSGLILWFQRKKGRLVSAFYLLLATVFSLSSMLYLWLLG